LSNIHSYDVVRTVEEFPGNHRPSVVHSIGGGRETSVSRLEAIILGHWRITRSLDSILEEMIAAERLRQTAVSA
jgi:hypothetical protein